MPSPALRLKQRVQAAKNGQCINRPEFKVTADSAKAAYTEHNYALAKSRLQTLRDQMSGENLEVKAEIKRKALDELLPYLQGYLDSGQRYQNDVLVFSALWLIDIGDIDNGFKFGSLAIEQQQKSPFRREYSEVFCEAIFEWSERKIKANESAAPYLEATCEQVLTGTWFVDAPKLHSMLFVLLSREYEKAEGWGDVERWCEAAKAANPEGAGVKTRLNKARAKLGKPAL